VKFDEFKQQKSELERLQILKPTENIKDLFSRLDLDQNGSLETMEACIEITGQVRNCVKFDDLKDDIDYDYKWDLDRNNYLNEEEYFMGKANNPFEKRHIEEEFKFFDADSDGDVTFEEIETVKKIMAEIEEVKEVFGIIDPTDDYAT
jgi:Ca2+-binding EF-hand superfamily protein